MRFQKRILVTYIGFLVVSVMVICIMYYQSSWKRYIAQEQLYLKTLSNQMMRQVELEYISMQEATESLLSDADILENLKILSFVSEKNNYRREAENKINIRLNTYHIVKNYYRVLIYNRHGDVFASYDFDERKVDKNIPKEQEKWVKNATGMRGKTMLIPPHEDPWGIMKRIRVYGIIREILGPNLGYLEVQQTEESLRRIFEIYDTNVRVAAFYGEGQVLYGDDNITNYYELGKQRLNGVVEFRNPETKKEELVSSAYFPEGDVTILVAEEKDVILQKMSGVLRIGFCFMAIFIGVFAFFMIRVSRKIAKPIEELRCQMEQASFDNLEEEIRIENSMDEIQALSDAYGRLLKRLKSSLANEKNLSYLQLQARYDLLQAQINPHFFYNVLNVIAARGLSVGDETICEICESLSGMLRYSTGNKTRYATIADEVHYLEQYLYLMKLRYQHKLEYEIKVDNRILCQIVPKIVFQQIVENSIQHGFNSSAEVMRIEVKGIISNDGKQWTMEFRDNGVGIDSEILENLKREMEKVKTTLLMHHQGIEMEIGGMGLLNTYARLVLFYEDKSYMNIQGNSEGTVVFVTAPVNDKEEYNVSGADCR